ncbi:hypothetical protein LLEC1_01617 [Akanthomyces lecanii]|uniref:Mitochondrial 2-oxoglutarate/malate carrier protein n=1 Tax=Cordyceps confragosa TaxID=2714763 RepID=A0A179IKL3_CORDF|nr:hypothetical protein LLEC1_01617 [Akanthomyces lecanii]
MQTSTQEPPPSSSKPKSNPALSMTSGPLKQAAESARTRTSEIMKSDTVARISKFIHTPYMVAALPFINGGISGMVATTVVQPVDMVKVRIQLAGEGTALGARAKADGRSVGFKERATAGLSAGGLAAMIGNPADLALIRMQSDGLKPLAERKNYKSVIDALSSIAKSEGVGALWAGAAPTVARAMALNFGQLAFFSEAKAQLKQNTDLSPRIQTLTASATAGFFASFFSLPFDFVKTRLQKQQKGPDGKLPYKGMADCFTKVAKQEGIMRFYRGFGTYYVRIAPHAMVTLIVADYLGWLTK